MMKPELLNAQRQRRHEERIARLGLADDAPGYSWSLTLRQLYREVIVARSDLDAWEQAHQEAAMHIQHGQDDGEGAEEVERWQQTLQQRVDAAEQAFNAHTLDDLDAGAEIELRHREWQLTHDEVPSAMRHLTQVQRQCGTAERTVSEIDEALDRIDADRQEAQQRLDAAETRADRATTQERQAQRTLNDWVNHEPEDSDSHEWQVWRTHFDKLRVQHSTYADRAERTGRSVATASGRLAKLNARRKKLLDRRDAVADYRPSDLTQHEPPEEAMAKQAVTVLRDELTEIRRQMPDPPRVLWKEPRKQRNKVLASKPEALAEALDRYFLQDGQVWSKRTKGPLRAVYTTVLGVRLTVPEIGRALEGRALV